MNRKYYYEKWKEKFKIQNGRNPTHLEDLSFRVGFNAGEESEIEQDSK